MQKRDLKNVRVSQEVEWIQFCHLCSPGLSYLPTHSPMLLHPKHPPSLLCSCSLRPHPAADLIVSPVSLPKHPTPFIRPLPLSRIFNSFPSPKDEPWPAPRAPLIDWS